MGTLTQKHKDSKGTQQTQGVHLRTGNVSSRRTPSIDPCFSFPSTKKSLSFSQKVWEMCCVLVTIQHLYESRWSLRSIFQELMNEHLFCIKIPPEFTFTVQFGMSSLASYDAMSKDSALVHVTTREMNLVCLLSWMEVAHEAEAVRRKVYFHLSWT